MSVLKLSFLGAPRVELDGEPLAVSRRKALALLCYLAVTQQAHSRDVLAALFWPEAEQSRALGSLRSALWALNKTPLADWLATDGEAVALREGESGNQTLIVDVLRFRALLAEAEKHEHAVKEACAHCLELYREAIELYRDEFMAGFTLDDAPAFDEWEFFEADSLRQSLAAVLQAVIATLRRQGNPEQAIAIGRRYVALDPLHEEAHRLLMASYAEAGQPHAALRQYEVCREWLAEELGVEPEPETEKLLAQIRTRSLKLEGVGAVEGSDASNPVDGDRPVPHNLPPEPAGFVGRKEELAQLGAFLADEATRLVTVTGAGGIGKTRLALAAAHEQVALQGPAAEGRFRDGVFFVSLAPLAEVEAIVPAIAEATGYPFQRGERPPREQVFGYLSRKRILVLLDNFEPLLQGAENGGAALVAGLLQRAPGVKVLATSREPLQLYGEQRLPLKGFAVVDEAVELFVQVAQRRMPDFAPGPEDMRHITEICRLVDGMPLALELAAAWTEALSLEAIAVEIRQNLAFMETSMHNVPARHRSMEAVFASSWQALDPGEQVVYARLSVFRGGFTGESARAVADASPRLLRGLVHKSLLYFAQARGRYEIHELLRQFAAARLGEEAEEVRQRHAEIFAALLAEREEALKGAGQRQALAEIEADRENVEAAWQQAVEMGRTDLLEQGLMTLCLAYERRTRLARVERLCGMAVVRLEKMVHGVEARARRTLLLARLLTWQGRANLYLERYDVARQLMQRASALLDRSQLVGPEVDSARAFLLLQLSFYEIMNEFGGEATRLNEESLALYRALGDAWGTAWALDALSQKRLNLGQRDEAIRMHEECLAIRREIGDELGVARSYNILGLIVLHAGQIEQAERYLRESLAIYRTMDNKAYLSLPLAVLGINQVFAGNYEASIAAYEEARAIHDELGLENEPLSATVGTTLSRINLGQYEEAEAEARRDLPVFRAQKHHWNIAFTQFNLARVALVRGEIDEAIRRSEESVEILQRMEGLALLPDVLFTLAFAYILANERRKGAQKLVEGLRAALSTSPLNPMRFELPGMALLKLAEGRVAEAITHHEAGLQSKHIANSRWFEDLIGRRVAEAAATLSAEEVAAARAAGHGWDWRETAKAILEELESGFKEG